MKTYLFFITLAFALMPQMQAQTETTRLFIDLSSYFGKPRVRLSGNGLKEDWKCDSTRKLNVEIPIKESGFFTLSVDLSTNELYLEPGKELRMTATVNEKGEIDMQKLQFQFEGANADINTYLNTFDLERMTDQDFLMDEKSYLQKIERLEKENRKAIKKYKLSPEFEKQELFRTRYKLLEAAARYPVQHFWKGGNQVSIMLQYDDTPIVKDFLAKQLIDDEKAWKDSYYQKFARGAVSILATSDFALPAKVATQKRIDTLIRYFHTPVIVEDMIQHWILGYVERTEGEPLGELQEVYDTYVSKPEYKDELVRTYAVWERLKAGKKVASADSAYQDITGKWVRLSDLKGKYIYIDVWATWCGPCRAEIPALKELEAYFHGKNIHFVSISLDNRRSDWAKMVEKEKLGGIQLLGGPGAQIAIDYKITGIPRFILIDPEGNLVDNNMTRPSDPTTKKKLEELLGF